MQASQTPSPRQPLAIVGIGCRLPGGVCGPDDYWDLIYNAKDGIVDVPKERWSLPRFYDADPETPGKVYVRSGGFLQQKIDEFDALFFGITPREAACMDPQQRLLLEVAWEALEDSGLNPYQLAGADVGVYVGAFTLDNNLKQMSAANRNIIGAHTAVGSTMTILSNRLSYAFDFRGPSLSIDTACSSSLVAFHYACQDLWRGTCSIALAGGVNVMFMPEYTIAMCKGHFLSPDGRCKSFDDRANGYGRGEGAGIVVLKPMAAAIADRDRIYAIVRATGCNQDGRTSGITVPNPDAQATLLRRVCADAGIAPQRVVYVEAHGTGTQVGDPSEAAALGSVVGAGRQDGDACAIGSVKSNIGHLEAASGIAGVIKAALCANNRTIPPLARLQTPNRAIPFEKLGLRLPVNPERMAEEMANVAINSFGYGGTNACALLSAPTGNCIAAALEEHDSNEQRVPCLLPLSARNDVALRQLAKDYEHLLNTEEGPSLRDVCYSAGGRRGHHSARAAVWAASRKEMSDLLRSFTQGSSNGSHVSRATLVDGDRPIFVFTGMGPQWWGMGQELYNTYPVYRETVEQCDSIFREMTGWSILEDMLRVEQKSRMQETQIAQPANFIIQVGLTALLGSLGIKPAGVVGHSVGEVSSAYIAGVLNLEDAIRVSYHRSRVQKRAAGLGSMLAVGMAAEDAVKLLASHVNGFSGPSRVSLAAANSPSSVTLAGDTAVLHAIASTLETRGVFNRFLQVEVPYHSPFMEPLREDLLTSLHGLRTQHPAIPLYSTVTGNRVESVLFDPDYWWKNVRQPVQFVTTMRKLIADGHKVFLEVGPHPVLSSSIKECLAEAHVEGAAIGTLRRGEPEGENLFRGIGLLYTCGAEIDWTTLNSKQARFVSIPRYPWQRETYWHETPAALRDRVGEPDHRLLGDREAGPQRSWQAVLNRGLVPYLDDHRVEGLRVLPGAAYVELGLAIQNAIGNSPTCVLENLRFHQALVIDDGDERSLRCTLNEKTREYAVYSQSRGSEAEWQLHATGSLPAAKPEKRERIDCAELRKKFAREQTAAAHYQDMARRGLQYGKYFQGVRELFLDSARGEVLARIENESLLPGEDEAYWLHPSLLDACFQALLSVVPTDDTYVPVQISQMRFFERPPKSFWCHGMQQEGAPGTIEGNLTLFDDKGEVLAQVRGITARKLTDKQSMALQRAPEWLYRFEWVSKAPSDEPFTPTPWIVFVDEKGVGEELVPLLAAQNAKRVVTVRRGSCFTEEGPDRFRISSEDERDFDRLLQRVGPENCARIAYLWGLDAPFEQNDIAGSGDAATGLRVIQALVRADTPQPFHLFVVTRGAHPITPDLEVSLSQAPLTGLLRVALNEYPEHRFSSIDLDPKADPQNLAGLAKELAATDAEDEIALRGTDRYVHRLVRQPQALDAADGSVRSELVLNPSSFKVELEKDGPLTSARLRENERAVPRADEVEIQIEAFAFSGSGRADGGTAIDRRGGDGRAAVPRFDVFGTVIRAGSNVKEFRPGDLIVACLPHAAKYATFAPADECIAHRPRELSYANGLGLLPFVFATHALETVGLRPGERVFVHASSESGLAALQIARRMGAEVFAATVPAEGGNAPRVSGAHHTVSGSAAEFPDELLALTMGAGVDVVFGTETGEMLTKSVEVLARGGRYIHFQEKPGNESLPLSIPVSGSRSFAVFDWRTPSRSWPDRFRKLWKDVCSQAEMLTPASRPEYSIGSMAEALGAATKRGHESAVTVIIDDLVEVERAQANQIDKLFDPNAWYLVTGGFGGLGLTIGHWMVRQGAKHLILAGRRGAVSDEARQAVAAMERDGAEIWQAALDITDREHVGTLFTRLAEQAIPLRGVLHAAAVFDDAPIHDLNRHRVENVMAAKALGAFYLHEFTRDWTLDFFVVFSSISAQVGSPGQASYVAANAYLDAFAHWRRAQGLPATSINWGAISEVGILSRYDAVETYLKRVGNRPFSPAQCSQMLGRVIRVNPVQISVVDVDWHQWAQFHPAWASSARFQQLIASEAQNAGADRDDFYQSLMAMEEGARIDAVHSLVIQSVAKTMQLRTAAIDSERSLVNMGLDSLMAMELQVVIEREMGVKLSTLELMKGTTIKQLSQNLLRRLLEATPEHPAPGPASHVMPRDQLAAKSDVLTGTHALERLDELSGEELDSLLIDLSKA